MTKFCVDATIAHTHADWRRWCVIAFAASLALSAYKSIMASTVNNDGLLYLRTAQVFVEQGLKAAFELLSWPFFSLLIGGLHRLTGLDYEAAAHTLDGLLLAFLSAGFVLGYRELSNGKGLPWVAAAVIVVSPLLNDYRTYIVRDLGYWAAALWAMVFFVRHDRSGAWSDAIAWQICIAVAIAFRIEGVAPAALLPLWQIRERPCGRAWLRNNSLFLSGALIVGVLWLTRGFPGVANSRLDQLAYFLSLEHLGAGFAAKTEAIARHVQSFYAPDDAKVLLIGGACFLFLQKTLTSLSWTYTALLAGGAWIKKHDWPIKRSFLLGYAIAVCAIPLIVFAVNDLFLSGRYMGLITVLLSLPVVAGVETILRHGSPGRPHAAMLLALVFAILLADIFIQTGPSKRYLRDAGNWVQHHIPADHRLCSNDVSAYYYAGRGFVDKSCKALEYLERAEANDYDAFFIKLGRKETDSARKLDALLAERNDLHLASQFANKAGDKIVIVVRRTTDRR